MYSPVYISPRVRQAGYLTKSFLTIDVWVINDLHKSYNNSVLSFTHNDKVIFEIENFTLPANDVVFIDWETLKTPIADHFNEGEHNIYITLLNDNKIIAKSDFTITVTNNKLHY